MKKRVFWTWCAFRLLSSSLWLLSSGSHSRYAHTHSYTLDRMMAITLGRPPGISDDDIDVPYPDAGKDELDLPIASMRVSSVVSAIHYFKLKRIESRIQREIYSVAKRNTPKGEITRVLLQEVDRWEGEIPVEAKRSDHASGPCCSADWFELRGAEARLHLLRPICTEQSDEAEQFVPLLAKYAARGCELQ